MKIKSILVATDFSECSALALEQASSLARSYGAKLLIVHVDESGQFSDGAYAGWPVNEHVDVPRQQLEAVVPHEPVEVSRHMLSGTPAHEIAHFAEANKVDLIVIGTHGRTGLGRLVLGSVAERLLRYAECPVLTVRASAGEDDSGESGALDACAERK